MSSTDQKTNRVDHAFAATILSRGARAIAAEATARLLDSHTSAAAGFGPDPFAAWQNWLAARVEELSAAVGLNEPELFVEQTRWASAVLMARGIEPAVFRLGLDCLRKAVEEESPQRVRELVTAPIDLATASFPADHSQAEHAWSTPTLEPADPYGKLAAEYLLAALEGDNRRARQMILDAVNAGTPLRDLYLRVLCAAQREVGRMWLNNEITIADEHLCSTTTRRVMGQLVQLADIAPPNGKTVVTANVAGDRHDIGQQSVADFFEIDGWRTLQLGPDVPASALLEVIETTAVDLLALSASLAVHLPVLRETIAIVRASDSAGSIKIIVGGRAFQRSTDLVEQLGADAFASDAEQAVAIGRRLVG